MSKILGLVPVIILISLICYFYYSSKIGRSNEPNLGGSSTQQTLENSTPPTTDIQSSFAIFTNGIFRVFTASTYHNLSTSVYIESGNPNIVRVKKAGITWNDFFATLPFKLTPECLTTGTKETFCTGRNGTLQFYLNGEKNINALSEEIRIGDKLLVTFGRESEEEIRRQMDKIP